MSVLVNRETTSKRYANVDSTIALTGTTTIQVPIVFAGSTVMVPVNIPMLPVHVDQTMCKDCGSIVANVSLHDNFHNTI